MAVSVAVKMRGNTTSVTRELKFSAEIEETCVSKKLDETVRLHSDKREE